MSRRTAALCLGAALACVLGETDLSGVPPDVFPKLANKLEEGYSLGESTVAADGRKCASTGPFIPAVSTPVVAQPQPSLRMTTVVGSVGEPHVVSLPAAAAAASRPASTAIDVIAVAGLLFTF